MLELMLCSMLTILPDFLFRRFVQGKRIGREINLFSVWYELRYGITACVLLTISLITTVFFFHPATHSAVSFFRTVPILTERIGRVEEVYVGYGRQQVAAGEPLFRLDTQEQEATAETARRRIAEIEAQIVVAEQRLREADGRVVQAQGMLQQALDEFNVRAELQQRNPDAIPQREVDQARVMVESQQGALAAAEASREALRSELDFQLPAGRATAEAQLAEAETDIAKSTVVVPVDGWLEQFTLRTGDIINPMLRPAGILVPIEAGRTTIQGGFGQIEASNIKVGMIGEVTCMSLPFQIVPVVATGRQEVIAAGQIRPTDVLMEPQANMRPGSVLVYLEPLFEGGFDRLPPGSSCIANLYTSNHLALEDPDLGTFKRLGLHLVDTVGLVHALILRIQTVLMPVQTLVFGGGGGH
jgi:multidrug resistance efflux pump